MPVVGTECSSRSARTINILQVLCFWLSFAWGVSIWKATSEPLIGTRAIRFVTGVLVQLDRCDKTLLFPEPVNAPISSNLPNPGGELSAGVGVKCADRAMYPK